jgi:hypothetical protein
MAEFQEVVKQAKRMCKAQHNCYECPANVICNVNECHKRISCVASISDYKNVERIVMNWAAEHPEPMYPTWEEWHKTNFPGARHDICPNYFIREKPLGTCAVSCKKCTNTPIPADIAEKLGIKPIGGSNDA